MLGKEHGFNFHNFYVLSCHQSPRPSPLEPTPWVSILNITFWFFIISLHHRNTFFILNITFAFTFLSLCSIKSEYVLMAISCHTRLRWEMAPKLDSSMISGVGIWPLRRLFRFILYCLRKRCLCCDSLENLWWFQSIEHELC
jgi:hypothetical protein